MNKQIPLYDSHFGWFDDKMIYGEFGYMCVDVLSVIFI